ncbi:MAG TPA: tetratricopeptide repeat protein [Pyrinomonadaceae bacterium]|nr:tetratricopeptide repeat protein [Pyrinomonadaceae bacterium]
MRYPKAVLCLLLFVTASAFSQQPDRTGKADFERGIQLISEEKFEEALIAFREAARRSPNEPSSHANIGKLHLVLNRPSAAVSPLRTAVRLAPDEATFRIDLCRALSLTKDHDAAISECETAVKLDQNSELAHSALFVARQQAGRPTAELLRTVDLALGLLRDSEVLLVLAADQYFLAGDYLYAQELLERLVTLRPQHPAYHGRLAEAYLRSGRDADALASARRALSIAPDDSFGNFAMGLLFYELGQHHEAIEAFSKVRSTEQRLSWATYYRAVSLSRIGRRQEAVTVLEDLAQRNPDEFQYHYELGNILTNLSRYEDAAIPLFRAVELQPDSMPANSSLGLALFESARYEEALRYLDKAQALEPANEIVAMFIRVTRARSSRVPQIDDMKRFAAENPTDVEVRRSLVEVLSYARRADEAAVYAKQLYELDPRDPELFVRIGVGYSTAGLHDEAKQAFEHSLSISDNPAAHLNLGALYLKSGEPERAFASFERVIAVKPDAADVMFMYGIHLANHGKRREALDILKRSIALKPANGGAIFNAGVLSEKLGEHQAALQYLDMLRPLDGRLAGILERCIKLRILR